MSLLALMHIGIGGADNAPMQPVQAPMRLRLTESEVRRLIDMGVADANAATGIDPAAEPFTFKNLHASLAPMLGGISVDQLAKAYSEYYASHGDSLVGQVLQGQPIDPETPLLRTQMWLMVADAVMTPARPRASLGAPRLVFASNVLQPMGGSTWGDGTLLPNRRPLASPEPRFSDAEWQEIVVRLNLLGHDGFTISPGQSPDLHEGHGGPGAPAVFRGRLAQSAPPLVSSITGRVLLTPRSGGAAGLTARVYDLGLEEHGTWNVARGGSMAFDATGSMPPISFTPKTERARTRSAPIVRAGGILAVEVPTGDLLNALYTLPAIARQFGWGTRVATADLRIGWHPVDAIDVVIHNVYFIPNLDLGLFNAPTVATRGGNDWARLTLERQEDGSYRGSGVLSSKSQVMLRGKQCSDEGPWVSQRADVLASPIPMRGGAADGFYNSIWHPAEFAWRPGEQAAEYLRLEFTPTSKPFWHGPKDPCQDAIQKANTATYFIPLNDARWTVGQGSGIALAIPERGPLHYKQLVIKVASPPPDSNDTPPFSTWTYRVQRTGDGR